MSVCLSTYLLLLILNDNLGSVLYPLFLHSVPSFLAMSESGDPFCLLGCVIAHRSPLITDDSLSWVSWFVGWLGSRLRYFLGGGCGGRGGGGLVTEAEEEDGGGGGIGGMATAAAAAAALERLWCGPRGRGLLW